jgi:hypothetical protein
MPPRKVVSDFMISLNTDLQKTKGVAETTALQYINTLKQLNDNKSYSNLGFLKKKDVIMAKIAEYAESTQGNILKTIVSVLTSKKDSPAYKTIYNFYYERMMEASKQNRQVAESNEKNEKQEANWLSWKDVLNKREELAKAVAPILKAKVINAEMWNTLLAYTILSLYTYMPPRRNQDYQDLYVVKTVKPDMPKDKNYLDLSENKFVFNKYKTSKKHGAQTQEIKDNTELLDIIHAYLKMHPHRKQGEFRFLVNADGSALSSVNAITRILNKVFGKQVGSSMLRHIYLSDKYGDTLKEMKEDAQEMGHTVAQQKEYVKV